MVIDKEELLRSLQLELRVLERGGYEPSVREPKTQLRVFRDSVSCPNVGLEIKQEPCLHCWLDEFVPLEHRDKPDACHYIPLNERGDTVASLSKTSDEATVQQALRSWLQKTIAQLQSEVVGH